MWRGLKEFLLTVLRVNIGTSPFGDMRTYKGSTDTATENSTQDNTQRSDRQHTGLRTLARHDSARDVYHALACPYAGVHILQQKERQRADESAVRVQQISDTAVAEAAATRDRSGEQGVTR